MELKHLKRLLAILTKNSFIKTWHQCWGAARWGSPVGVIPNDFVEHITDSHFK